MASPRSQRLRNRAITVAAALLRQFDDIGREPRLVVATLECLALRRAMLTERQTRAALGDLECALDVPTTARRGAGLNGFPSRLPASPIYPS